MDAAGPYRIALVKRGSEVVFFIRELCIFHWRDDSEEYGRLLGGGRIGFRQMAPLMGEYANLKVEAVA